MARGRRQTTSIPCTASAFLHADGRSCTPRQPRVIRGFRIRSKALMEERHRIPIAKRSVPTSCTRRPRGHEKSIHTEDQRQTQAAGHLNPAAQRCALPTLRTSTRFMRRGDLPNPTRMFTGPYNCPGDLDREGAVLINRNGRCERRARYGR
jgi:hypothetical protein